MTRDRRQPAEWEPHEACWAAWPSHAELWLDNLEPARRAHATMDRAIAEGERLELLVRSEADEASARAALTGADVRYHRIAYGDIWLRDTAPIFTVEPAGGLTAVRFRFNGWGGKYLFSDDVVLSAQVAGAAHVADHELPIVLEGGAIDVDGEGTALTTRQCLLNPNRNPGLDEAAYARHLAPALGIARLVWLEDGLQNDHTDGHVDTIARFVAPGVVACMEPAQGDPNRDALARVIQSVGATRDARGRALEAALVPSPGAVVDADGALMPASYLNFYIGNATVVVPTYGAANDDAAVAAVAALFPDRRTVGVDARAVLTGGGAFHCITQQQPAVPAREER